MESANLVGRIASERRRGRRFVLRERRSGFERRRRQGPSPAAALDKLLVYLRTHAVALLVVLIVANLLSLFDLVFTLHVLRLGGTEGNPLMAYLLAASPGQATLMKLVVVAGASVLVWRLRRYRLSLLAALFALGVYGSVVIYECLAVTHLV